jgi:hypothetical protein
MIKLIGLLGSYVFRICFNIRCNNKQHDAAANKQNEGCCHEHAEIGAMPHELNAFQEHPFHFGKS